MKKVPVLILAFNRPDHVERVMKAVRDYQPERLYLACDGPRGDREGENLLVETSRRQMLDAVNWPCDVKTLFRPDNLGCAEGVYDAISWFFRNEEWGIICEDDIILSQDFFKLCEILLPRFSNEDKIMEISARNESQRKDIDNTYVFSQCFHCWGWATWSRAWKKMDMTMSATVSHSLFYYAKRLGLFRGVMMNYYFSKAHKSLPEFNSWATRWYLSILDNDGLVVCPGVNLALNIGCDGGTHYSGNRWDPFKKITIGKVCWPIEHNDLIIPDKIQKKYDSRVFMRVRLFGLVRKIRKLFYES